MRQSTLENLLHEPSGSDGVFHHGGVTANNRINADNFTGIGLLSFSKREVENRFNDAQLVHECCHKVRMPISFIPSANWLAVGFRQKNKKDP